MEAKEIKGLWEAYVSVYTNLSESHFKVGDKVICKKSGMKGEVVKLDNPDGAEDEKYYTVEREDGKKMKYSPNELKSAGNGGVSKEKEEKFHTKLDKLVHKTFGSSPEEKKMKEEVEIEEAKQSFPAERVKKQMEKARKGSVYGRKTKNEPAPNPTDSEQRNTTRFSKMFHASEKAKREKQEADRARRSPTFYRDTHPASAPKMKKVREEVETDLFDYILEHLVAEGYADTNEAALAIMANMSEEWREDIVEAAKDQSNKQIEKGIKTTYKAGNVIDNQHQGRSSGLSRLPSGERVAKTKRMRERLKGRRDDLFKERGNREDAARAELKKRLGL